ncbi:hypothetical protein [Haloarchaeobius sp. TZWWS8]|uniref:hypothetical protein n=1 Tax=Haloarchaeobius sp. TZWWS8 TaxID=3446121 RepID=UPI003EBF2D49
MRTKTLTRREILGLVAGGTGAALTATSVVAAPMGDDGETFSGNRIAVDDGSRPPRGETASETELDLRVAWAETINGFPVDAFPPGERPEEQAVIWSRDQLEARYPDLDADAIEARFDAQFTDIDALLGDGSEPLLDLSAVRPGDSGSVTVYLNLAEGTGLVGVTGAIQEETGGAARTTAAGTVPLADAVELTVVQLVRTQRGFRDERPLASGSLGSVLTELALQPALLDGDPSSPTVGCTTPADILAVRFDWALPRSAGRRVSTEPVTFDLGFVAVACEEAGASLSLTSRAWTQGRNRLIYVLRVENHGDAPATNVLVEPVQWQRDTKTGTASEPVFAACTRDGTGALALRAMRIRRGQVGGQLTEVTRWHARDGRTYGDLYDPVDGVWEIPTIRPGEAYDLLLNLHTGACASGETVTNGMVVSTEPWWNDRNPDRTARTTGVSVTLD